MSQRFEYVWTPYTRAVLKFLKRILKGIFRRIYWKAQRVFHFFGISIVFLDPIDFKFLKISTFTPIEEIRDVLTNLRPVNNGFKLERIGFSSDGGYLAPSDLIGISRCFSAGCDLNWSFEKDLENRYGIYSHIIDSEEKKPLDLSPGHSFTPMWIGTKNSSFTVTLDDWISTHTSNEDAEYLLQMDIEGFEWIALKNFNVDLLRKFRILIIEFHNTGNLINYRHFQETFRPIIQSLSSYFDPVHIHGNNCCGLVTFQNFQFPQVFELTLHRKDRGKTSSNYRELPHEYDQKNVSSIEDLKFEWPWSDVPTNKLTDRR